MFHCIGMLSHFQEFLNCWTLDNGLTSRNICQLKNILNGIYFMINKYWLLKKKFNWMNMVLMRFLSSENFELMDIFFSFSNEIHQNFIVDKTLHISETIHFIVKIKTQNIPCFEKKNENLQGNLTLNTTFFWRR